MELPSVQAGAAKERGRNRSAQNKRMGGNGHRYLCRQRPAVHGRDHYGANGRMTVEWDPCAPIKNGKGQLTKIGLKRYQECRNQLAQQVADYLGGAVLMVD